MMEPMAAPRHPRVPRRLPACPPETRRMCRHNLPNCSPRCLRVAALALAGWAFASTGFAADVARGPSFEKEILPILKTHCVRCHGAEKRKAALDVRSKAGLLRGGENGPALVPGAVDRSLLWAKLADDKMPPGDVKLAAAEKAILKEWITAGAARRRQRAAGGWAGSTGDRRRPPLLVVPAAGPPCRPLGQAVLARSQSDRCVCAGRAGEEGADVRPRGGPLVLLRRATFDLTGLPPTPEEIDEFLSDKRPDAYERLIDRLLASPRLWRAAGRDTGSTSPATPIPRASSTPTMCVPPPGRYRDYVIRAFNADKPWDRFIQEQLAGDELYDYWTAYQSEKALPARVIEGLVATGYLRCASDTSRPDFVNIKNAPGYYHQDAQRHRANRVVVAARPDGALCPLPQPQVRPDPADRLLSAFGDLHERLSSGTVGAAGAASSL